MNFMKKTFGRVNNDEAKLVVTLWEQKKERIKRSVDYYDLLDKCSRVLSSPILKEKVSAAINYCVYEGRSPVFLLGYIEKKETHICRIVSTFPPRYGPVTTVPYDVGANKDNIADALSKL